MRKPKSLAPPGSVLYLSLSPAEVAAMVRVPYMTDVELYR